MFPLASLCGRPRNISMIICEKPRLFTVKVRPRFFTRTLFGRVNRAQVSLDSYRLILTISDDMSSRLD